MFQAGAKSIKGHRAVLAAASPYLFDLFRNESSFVLASEMPISYRLDQTFDWQSLEIIVEYCYTAK
jgi:influenza virus NS1A-binding protein